MWVAHRFKYLCKSNKLIRRLNDVKDYDWFTYTGIAFQQSKYMWENDDRRFSIKFEDCRRKEAGLADEGGG